MHMQEPERLSGHWHLAVSGIDSEELGVIGSTLRSDFECAAGLRRAGIAYPLPGGARLLVRLSITKAGVLSDLLARRSFLQRSADTVHIQATHAQRRRTLRKTR